MKALTEQQVRDYRYNGFLFPIPALTPAEAAKCLGDLERIEAKLGSQGRVLVRWSGTEPKLRLLVEGPTDSAVQTGLAGLEVIARAELEAI